MLDLSNLLLTVVLLIILPLFLLIFINKFLASNTHKISGYKKTSTFPKPYPLIGHLISIYQQKTEDIFKWLSSLIVSSPTSTFVLHRPFGERSVYTANPANVEHILKAKFTIYIKGPYYKTIFRDVFGDSMFTIDAEAWKLQRLISSPEFSHKSLEKYVDKVLNFEISERLIPILSSAAKNNKVLDLQDILQRFAFDNVCITLFGYDPAYLLPSLPQANFAQAFDDAVMVCDKRFIAFFPIIWKICRFLNVGDERKLSKAVYKIREFATCIVKQGKTASTNEENVLTRFLKHGHFDDRLIIDIVISFILAGRDTTSAALTWFFWLLNKNKHVEEEIISEISSNNNINNDNDTNNDNKSKKKVRVSVLEQLKDMTYTHAALCETMRLYPPVPIDLKQAAGDDVLPDGTTVKKGMLVGYFSHAMGRCERLWGEDWAAYRPERWLKEEEGDEAGQVKWRFVPRDAYSYPVFHGGPRICLGKEMAFLQMKKVVASVLERFRVVPVVEEGFEPVYVPAMTAKMEGGFPVRVYKRVHVG